MNKKVSNNIPQIGKYVDINGDGIPEGIIFADLAIGGKGRYCGDDNAYYKIPKIKGNLKEYEVIGTYNDRFNGEQEVLTPIGEGIDRFYVLSLNNYVPNTYRWYAAAHDDGISDYNIVTSEDFAAGRQNTLNMINKWNNSAYGKQNARFDYKDLWGEIQNEVKNGWFIPSRAEWAAFGDKLKININNYEKKGLEDEYFSSSLCNSFECFGIGFCNDEVPVNKSGYIWVWDIPVCSQVRLATII